MNIAIKDEARAHKIEYTYLRVRHGKIRQKRVSVEYEAREKGSSINRELSADLETIYRSAIPYQHCI